MKNLTVIVSAILVVLLITCTTSFGQTYTACANLKSGLMRWVANAGECNTKFEEALTWNVTGPQGPQGPQGPEGVGMNEEDLYRVTCQHPQQNCRCTDANDILLSGTASCPIDYAINWTHIAVLDPPDQYGRLVFWASCTCDPGPGGGCDATPLSIEVLCVAVP
jgi:hypothetical protein